MLWVWALRTCTYTRGVVDEDCGSGYRLFFKMRKWLYALRVRVRELTGCQKDKVQPGGVGRGTTWASRDNGNSLTA